MSSKLKIQRLQVGVYSRMNIIIFILALILCCLQVSASTVSPSEMPTVAPSETPSESPTVRPTKDPSIRPSRKPSVYPSLAPSKSPSQRPTTVQPTLRPTAVPTITPTARPTTPTQKPTHIPSVRPTRPIVSAHPTIAVTRAPTFTRVSVSFDATLYLFNVTTANLVSSDEIVVTTAMAEAMKLTRGTLNVLSSNSSIKHRHYDVEVIVNVVASTSDYPSMNDTALYYYLCEALIDAVVSDNLTASIVSTARLYNVSGLYHLSGVNVTFPTSYSAIPEVTIIEGGGHDGRVSSGAFAGIVIGILLSFMFLVWFCYYDLTPPPPPPPVKEEPQELGFGFADSNL